MLSDVPRLKEFKRSRRVPAGKGTGWYSDQQKLEAVQVWLMCGSMTQTAAALGIPAATIEKWRYTKWWKELADQIKAEGRVKLTGRLQKIVSRSLDQIEERIENGDWVLDSKTGQLIRKPLLARDLTRISTDFIDRANKLDSVAKEEATQQAVEDRLKLLADSFASFAKKVRRVEVEDAIQIQGPERLDVREQTEDGEEMAVGDSEGEILAEESEEVDGSVQDSEFEDQQPHSAGSDGGERVCIEVLPEAGQDPERLLPDQGN